MNLLRIAVAGVTDAMMVLEGHTDEPFGQWTECEIVYSAYATDEGEFIGWLICTNNTLKFGTHMEVFC